MSILLIGHANAKGTLKDDNPVATGTLVPCRIGLYFLEVLLISLSFSKVTASRKGSGLAVFTNSFSTCPAVVTCAEFLFGESIILGRALADGSGLGFYNALYSCSCSYKARYTLTTARLAATQRKRCLLPACFPTPADLHQSSASRKSRVACARQKRRRCRAPCRVPSGNRSSCWP